MTVIEDILKHIRHLPYGSVFTRQEISDHLGVEKSLVSDALRRLASSGELRHISRGLWQRPKQTRFGIVFASPESVVSALERSRDVFIVPAGAKTLNEIGASTQLPMKARFMATRRIRPLKLGNQLIEFECNKAFTRAMDALADSSPSQRKRVARLWVALQYAGERHATHEKEAFCKAFRELSPRERQMLLQVLTGELSWARSILI